MNYDVECNLCMKQGCGGAAKIARLQFRSCEKWLTKQPTKIQGVRKVPVQ